MRGRWDGERERGHSCVSGSLRDVFILKVACVTESCCVHASPSLMLGRCAAGYEGERECVSCPAGSLQHYHNRSSSF